ncbi:MAG: T9SS type A sorting domain-containing protein [Bacteroidales bacterium]|nr:T9SS type A sorting domain-containing protein [Bacteroidales bacterium]
MKNYCLIISGLLFLFVNINAYSQMQEQQDADNECKYWHYRERLKYFVYSGEWLGESHIVGIRNINNTGRLDIVNGQHCKYWGLYVGMLATEYKILSMQGKDYSKTLKELCYAFMTLEKKMDTYSNFPGDDIWWLNGFFVRCPNYFYQLNKNINTHNFFHDIDEVTGYCKPNEHMNKMNEGFYLEDPPLFNYTICSDYKKWNSNYMWDEKTNSYGDLPRGRPGYADYIEKEGGEYSIPSLDAMSQDEVTGILLGLSLVKKMLPDNYIKIQLNDVYHYDINFVQDANMMAQNIIEYMCESPYVYNYGDWPGQSHHWIIYQPNGSEVSAGADARWAAPAYYDIYKNFFGGTINMDMPGIYYTDRWKFYVNTQPMNDSQFLILLAIADNKGSETEQKIYSVAYGNNSQTFNWETFYLLFWAVLHDKQITQIPNNNKKIRDQINSAPFEGPYCYSSTIKAPYGWAGSYKWFYDGDEQNNGNPGFYGTFNGTDYMLLYNLYKIYSTTKAPLADCYPYMIPVHPFPTYSFGSKAIPGYNNYMGGVDVTSQILNHVCNNPSLSGGDNVGSVQIIADKITLKPGFKAENGVYFKAHAILSVENYCPDEISLFSRTQGTSSKTPIAYLIDNSTDKSTSDIRQNKNSEISKESKSIQDLKIFPNPFSNLTTINYNIAEDENIKICVYDVMNKKVAELVNEYKQSGEHNIVFDGSNLDKGIYFCTIETEGYRKTEKIVLIK